MENKVKKAMEAASNRFNELQKQIQENETELIKLQGEYRALQALLPDEALTIKAEESNGRRKPKS